MAAINNANLGTGTYSATVNWGDGKPTQAATVNVTGPSGTVTAPTHKYKAAGVFTVTTTVANTVGSAVTSVTTTESITVTGPTITSISPTSGPVGKKVTINGTDLAGATVKFAIGHVATIVSDTVDPDRREGPERVRHRKDQGHRRGRHGKEPGRSSP